MSIFFKKRVFCMLKLFAIKLKKHFVFAKYGIIKFKKSWFS